MASIHNGLEFDGFEFFDSIHNGLEFTTALSTQRSRIHNGLEFTTASSSSTRVHNGLESTTASSSSTRVHNGLEFTTALRVYATLVQWSHRSNRPQFRRSQGSQPQRPRCFDLIRFLLQFFTPTGFLKNSQVAWIVTLGFPVQSSGACAI